jgi:cytochrome c-type biogenesis protein CcmH
LPVINNSKRGAVVRGFCIVVILALTLFTIAAGQPRYDRVGHTLMCTCGCNQILLECNHVGCPNSTGMRDRLTTLINNGATDDAIYKDFIAEYGNIVVAAPLGPGFNRVAWIMPFAFLFVGIVGVGVVARKWRLRPATHAINTQPEEELDEFRQQARKDTDE